MIKESGKFKNNNRVIPVVASLGITIPFVVAYLYPYENAGFIQYGAGIIFILEGISIIVQNVFPTLLNKKIFSKYYLFFWVLLVILPFFLYYRDYRLLIIYFITTSLYRINRTKDGKEKNLEFYRRVMAWTTSMMIVILFSSLFIKTFPIPAESDYDFLIFYSGALYGIILAVFEYISWPDKSKLK